MKTAIILLLSVIILTMLVTSQTGSSNQEASIFPSPEHKEPEPITYIQNPNDTYFNKSIWINGLYRVTVANSTSMVPTIMPQQTVLVSEDLSRLKVGDIITYKYNLSTYYIHRIVQLNETHFTAKGDNNDGNDSIHPIEDIWGVVYAVLY